MHTGVKHAEVLFAVAAVVVSLGILPVHKMVGYILFREFHCHCWHFL